MNWREYHEATKHTPESLRRAPHTLDWANMPDPFRHYEGAPLLDLPADPALPESPESDGPALLSQLFFYSAAISASKIVPSTGYRYALRVNPSSGNLHPTEFHFITRGLKSWPDGLYHYRPSSHMAEQRALGDFGPDLGAAPITLILTSIIWREAWKYGERAYRYCLLDIGHAWQAIALTARAMGFDAWARGQFVDDNIAGMLRLSADECPMLIVELRNSGAGETVWSEGRPNALSARPGTFPLIDGIHAATKATARVNSRATFGAVARRRRSALDFEGGHLTMPLPQLMTLLAEATDPLHADFAHVSMVRPVQLYLYVHRVAGLPAGLYRYWPERSELKIVKTGDQRVFAAALSLRQQLAGNSCVTFSMIADLELSTRCYGDRGYRYSHFDAGAVGQRLYLGAEIRGLGATGIGAFFDDDVHRHLNLTPEAGQVVYHFAIGYPVFDLRTEA